jgi:hypothetical protein
MGVHISYSNKSSDDTVSHGPITGPFTIDVESTAQRLNATFSPLHVAKNTFGPVRGVVVVEREANAERPSALDKLCHLSVMPSNEHTHSLSVCLSLSLSVCLRVQMTHHHNQGLTIPCLAVRTLGKYFRNLSPVRI